VRAPVARILRLTGRLGLLALGIGVLAIVGVQFAGIVGKNMALASEVAASRTEIGALRAREAKQLRTIRRLSDPAGAIPQIHDRLHLVGPHEELIYLRGAPTAAPGGPGESP
jgi:cell division protein FtsB